MSYSDPKHFSHAITVIKFLADMNSDVITGIHNFWVDSKFIAGTKF